jgi:hypothetical protein
MLQYRILTEAIMNRRLSGSSLTGQTLATFSKSGQPVMLVFLPQLASVFAREAVQSVLAAAKHDPNYPQVIFFHHDDSKDAKRFFDKNWPRASAVADPGLFFYKEFGVPTGGLPEILHPVRIARGIGALLKGRLPQKPSSDPWTMQGTFVILDDQILWSHDSRYAGHFPRFAGMRQLVEALLAQSKRNRPQKNPAGDSLSRAG